MLLVSEVKLSTQTRRCLLERQDLMLKREPLSHSSKQSMTKEKEDVQKKASGLSAYSMDTDPFVRIS